MKSKWKLILLFFLALFICILISLIVRIPIFKPVQFSSIKINNGYKYFVTLNNINPDDVIQLKISQDDNEYLIDKDLIKFSESGVGEIKSINKNFKPDSNSKATAVLKSEVIMYYLINKTFSRK